MTKRNRQKFGRAIIQRRLPTATPKKDEIEKGQVDHDVVQYGLDYSGERSPYWDNVERSGLRNHEGDPIEPIEANPDGLSTCYDDYAERRTHQQEMIKEVVATLSPREREVFNMLAAGVSERDVARRLNIRRSSIETYRDRIKRKFDLYVVQTP